MMRINAHGAAAYAQAAQRFARPAALAAESEAKAPSFGDMLRNEVTNVAKDMNAGERAARDGLVGKASVQEVVEAVNAAELGLQKVTAVRDRVIAAYQEIMRMPI